MEGLRNPGLEHFFSAPSTPPTQGFSTVRGVSQPTEKDKLSQVFEDFDSTYYYYPYDNLTLF